MANEEISSLLLRVAIDFDAFEGFVNALPEVVSVAEGVGQALNATQIGNPALFAQKGEALSRALIAGLQAGALGLDFAGGTIAQQITNRVFGELDQATAQRYVRDVQRLLDQVQLSVPQLTAPLVNQQSLQGLGQVAQMASGSRRELEALSNTLDGVVARLSALSAVRLPQTFVRRTADRTGLELTPSARRAAEAIGISPAPNQRPGNVAGSSAAVGMEMVLTLRRQERELQAQQAQIQRTIANGQALLAASERPAITGPGREATLDQLAQALSGPARVIEGSAQRMARATDAAAREAERAARQAQQDNDRVAGRIAGPGGAEGNRLAAPVPPEQLLPFASADIAFARIDPLLSAITDNIRSHGIQQAITLEVAKDGLARIADGHHRLLAAQALGIQVPTVLQRSSLPTFGDGQPLPLGSPFGPAGSGFGGGEFATPLAAGLGRPDTEPGRLRALEAAARRNQENADEAARLQRAGDTVTSRGELFSAAEVATQAAQVRGQVTVFEAVAEAAGASQNALARLALAEDARKSLGQKPLTDAQRQDFLDTIDRKPQRQITTSLPPESIAKLERAGFIQPLADPLANLGLPPRTDDEQARLAARQAEAAAADQRRISDEAQARRDRLREDRARRALEEERLANQPVTLFRGEKTNGGIGVGGANLQGGAKALTDDGSRFFAPDPLTALNYASIDGMGFGGPTGRLLAVDLTRQEFNAQGGSGAKEFVLPPELVARARVVLDGTNEQLLRYRNVLAGPGAAEAFGGAFGLSGFEQRALPPGTGAAPRDFTAERRTDRTAARLAEISARRELELLDTLGPGFRGTGLAIGGPLNTGPRLSSASFAPEVTARELTEFTRATNIATLRALDVNGTRDSATASSADLTPETLRRQLGSAAFDDLILGRGIGPKVSERLDVEQRLALGATDENIRSRFRPDALIDRDQARRELLGQRQDPNAPGPLAILPAERQAQSVREELARRQQVVARQMIDELTGGANLLGRGSVFDTRRLRPVSGPRGAVGTPDFEAAARALENLGRPALPAAPPLPRIAAPAPSVADREAALARSQAKFDVVAATGQAPPEILARLQEGVDAARRNLDAARAAAAAATPIRTLNDPLRKVGEPFLVGGDAQSANAASVAQRSAEITYLRNIAATRRLDEALARLEQQLGQTARAAELGVTSSLIGGPRTGVASLLTGALTSLVGSGSPLDPRLREAIAALSPSSAQRRALTGGPAPLGPIIDQPPTPQGPRLPPRFVPPNLLRIPQQAIPVGGGGGAQVPPGGGGGGGGGGGFIPPQGPFNPGPPIPPQGGRGQSFFGQARSFVGGRFQDPDTFLGGVRQGFSGGDDGGPGFFGRSVGSAARFSLVYGAAYSALRLFTTAFSEGVQGAIQFETALTNLNIATEQTGRANEQLAFQLSDLGASRGIAPGESVEAGARAIGLFGATDSSSAVQAEIATVSTDVASQIAFISGQTIEQVQTQLAGITRSFNVDPLQQSRIFDVASFVGRRTGRPAGELLQSLGQIGSLGGDAGFSLEQTAAIIARLTSTTGQTPQAVSGFLSQVLSRADDPRLQQRLRAVGVDTEGTTLAEQIEQLSGLDLPQGVRNQIVAGFGRGRSGQALGIILEQFPEIQALAGGAAGASGLGEEDFNQAVNTVGGQLRVLGASLKDLFTGLASTGVLDIFVGLLSATQGLVQALDAVVDVFNLIPREARSVAFILLEVYAALLLLSKVPVVNALAASALLRRGGTVIPGAGGAAAGARLDPNSSRTARAGAVGTALVGGVRTGALAGASAVGGLVGGGALAGGLLAGAGAAAVLVGVGIWDAFSQAASVDRSITNAFAGIFQATDQEGFDAARADLAAARKEQEEQDDFKLLSRDIFTLGGGNIFNDLTGRSAADREKIEQAERLLKEREEANKVARDAAIDTSPGAVFDGFVAGQESVEQGLQTLSDRGFTATRQLAALNQAFDTLLLKTDEAAGAVGVVLPGQFDLFLQTLAADLSLSGEDVGGRLRAQANSRNRFESGGFQETVLGGTGNVLSTIINGFNPFAFAGAGVGRAFANREAGINGTENFTSSLRALVSPLVGEAGDQSLVGLIGGAIREFDPTRDNDRERAKKLREANNNIQATLNDPGVQDRLDEVTRQAIEESGQNPDQGAIITPEIATKIKEARRRVLAASFGEEFARLPQDIQDSILDGFDQDFDASLGAFNGTSFDGNSITAFLGGLRQRAAAAGEELALTTGDQLAGAQLTTRQFTDRRQTLVDRIASARARGDNDEAERLTLGLEQLDLDIARAEASEFDKRAARIDALTALTSAQFGGDPLQTALATAAGIQAKLADPPRDVEQRAALEAEAINQGFAVRRAQANLVTSAERANVNPGDQVGLAEVAVRDAQRQLEVAVPGTQAFYDAITSYNQAQKSYADAQLAAAQEALFRGIDPRDTLALADAAVKAAQLKIDTLNQGISAATPLADFDTAGNQVGTIDIVSKGKGIGQQVVQGLLAQNYTGAGAEAARSLLAGFSAASGAFIPGVSLGPAPTGVTGASGLPLGVLQGTEPYIDGTGASLFPGYTPEQIRAAQAAYAQQQRAGNPSVAVLPGRQGEVRQGGSLATSGRFAPKPGQLTGANDALIDLIVGSGASFGLLDGNIVPRATADGGISSHSFGNALDIFGTPEELAALVTQLTPLAGNGLRELIYTPTGTFLGAGGQAFDPSKNVRDNHQDHIHAQVDDPDAIRQLVAGNPAFAGVTLAPSQQELDAAAREKARAEQEQRQAVQDFDIAKINSEVNPRDSTARAQADLQIAERILQDQIEGTTGYFQALAGVNEAQSNLARTYANAAYSLDQANATRAQSPLAAASAALRTAGDRLANEIPGTVEYNQALADYYTAAQNFAEATREAQAVSLRLSSDITDPVEQAAIDLRTANAKRDQVRRNGGDQAAIEAADLEARQAFVAFEQAQFDQRLNRARTDAELGRTSQQEYIAFLESEEARLTAISDRTEQEQQQLDTITRELQNLNKQLTGQFNLGDINVPTPYDARRIVAQDLADRDAAVPGFGGGPRRRRGGTNGVDPTLEQQGVGGFGAASASVVYNQQGAVSNTYISVNGGDINEVKAVMQQYLGAGAFQRSTVSTAKV